MCPLICVCVLLQKLLLQAIKTTEVNIRRRRLRLQRPPLLLPLSPPLPRVETGNAQPAVWVPVSASSRLVQDSAQARVLCNHLSNTTGSGLGSSSGSVQSFNQKHDRFRTRLSPGSVQPFIKHEVQDSAQARVLCNRLKIIMCVQTMM